MMFIHNNDDRIGLWLKPRFSLTCCADALNTNKTKQKGLDNDKFVYIYLLEYPNIMKVLIYYNLCGKSVKKKAFELIRDIL